jgi:hypothetical protein
MEKRLDALHGTSPFRRGIGNDDAMTRHGDPAPHPLRISGIAKSYEIES